MNYEQRESIGLKYVFDLLSPLSGPGARLLKRLPSFASAQREELERELDNVAAGVALIRNDRARFDLLRQLLAHVKDIVKTLERLAGETADEVELFEIKVYLESVFALAAAYSACRLNLAGIEFAAPRRAHEILNVGQNGGFYIADEYSAVLKDIRRRKRDLTRRLQKATGEAAAALKRQHLQLSAAEQNEESEVRAAISRKLAPYAEEMIADSKACARLDLVLEKARLAAAANAVRPLIGPRIELKNAVNPMIAEKLERLGRGFTPVSMVAPAGVTVITGANMGGKTVALKTVGLNAALLSFGFFVFAESAVLPLTSFVEIVSDNLQSVEKGLSSFGGEIAKVDALLRRSETEDGIILLDEFAGGTNPEEGAKIFRAALNAFNETNSFVIMTTHFDRVAAAAKAHYRVAGLKNAPWKELKNNGGLGLKEGVEQLSRYMDYSLLPAGSDDAPRDAIKICYLMGIGKKLQKYLE